MKLVQALVALVAAAALSSPASAVVFTGATGAGSVTDYSVASTASFDLDLTSLSSTTLNFVLEAGDFQSSTLNLNALVRNLSGTGIEHARFSLTGIGFAQAGSVTPAFGQLVGVTHNASSASLHFSAPEYAELQFGNPLGVAGKSNWQLDLTGLSAGSQFAVVAEVPEPSAINLMLAGLVLVALAVYGRRKR